MTRFDAEPLRLINKPVDAIKFSSLLPDCPTLPTSLDHNMLQRLAAELCLKNS